MPFLWSRFTRQEFDLGAKAKEVLPQGVLHEIKRFYYDTAQGHHEGAMAALRVLVPSSQIMFGSDYPSLPYERIFKEWNELGYKDEVMEKIMHGNAERVLGL